MNRTAVAGDHQQSHDEGRRASASFFAVAVFIVAFAYGVAAHGAFNAGAQRLFLAGVGASAALAWWGGRRVGRWWMPLALALPLAAWVVIAGAAAGDVGGAAPVLGILFGVAAAAFVGVMAHDSRELLVDGLLLIGAAVAALGWVGVVWRVEPLAMIETGLWRAASTLTYENAAAALLAPLAVVALARAATRPARSGDRLVATVLVVGVGVTMSRAGWLGLAVGLIVLAVAVPIRRLLPVAVPVLAGAAVAIAGVVAVSPAAVHRGQMLPVLALVAGGAISVARVTWSRRTVAIVGAVGAVGLVAAAAFVGPGAATFRTSRLSADSADRNNEWRATASVARRHLLTGVGPSHLLVRWRDTQGDVVAADYTHNEYLQLAAEDGVVAPVIAVVALALVGVALARRRSDWLAAGALGGLAAFAVHSAFDFMWHVPVVPVVVAALCGAALSGTGGRTEGQPPKLPVVGTEIAK